MALLMLLISVCVFWMYFHGFSCCRSPKWLLLMGYFCMMTIDSLCYLLLLLPLQVVHMQLYIFIPLVYCIYGVSPQVANCASTVLSMGNNLVNPLPVLFTFQHQILDENLLTLLAITIQNFRGLPFSGLITGHALNRPHCHSAACG